MNTTPTNWDTSSRCLGSCDTTRPPRQCLKRTKHWSGYCGQHRYQYKQESEAQ